MKCKFLYSIVLILMFVSSCFGQVTLRSTTAVAKPGDIVIDSIKTANFKNVLSVQFLYLWDTSVVSFIDIIGLNTLNIKADTSSGTNFLLKNTGAGSFFFVYLNSSLAGISLPDSASIFKVRFKVKGSKGAYTNLRAREDEATQQYMEIVQDSFGKTISKVPNVVPGFICVQECLVSSTTEAISEEVQIYPNPVTDDLTIDAGAEQIRELSIYDSFGRLLHHENRRELLTPKTTVSLKTFPKGLYVLNLKTNYKNYSRKLLKEID